MATGKRAGRGIKDRNIGDSAGLRPYKLDLTYASTAAFLAAKSGSAENSSSAEEGDFFYDTTLNGFRAHNGTDWKSDIGSVPSLIVYQEAFAFGDMTDGGGAAATFALSHSIPAGARFQACLIHGITGFAGDTSAVITVGDGTDVDRYNTGTPDVFTTAAAGVDMGVPSGTDFHAAAKTPTVTITSAADWGSVTAGACTLTLYYYRPV